MTLLKLFETLRGRGVKLDLDAHDNLSLVGRRELLDGELLGALKEN